MSPPRQLLHLPRHVSDQLDAVRLLLLLVLVPDHDVAAEVPAVAGTGVAAGAGAQPVRPAAATYT